MADGEVRIFKFPPELPVCACRERIEAAIRSAPVTIVCGDTGSGKTTQLPKMALELGFGSRGRMIACTQPRRLAATAMAERVAAELGCEVGGTVGFQHRFARRLSRETRIKFMTDGVLLAETREDPLLRRYDAIILDEAHERSLNVDFLLGILTRVLARRRDLKVVVSSATLDAGRFSEYFGGAPAIEVPGRLFPVEILYRPLGDGDERELPEQIDDALRELPPREDTLVFLPGERDIREAAEWLSRTRPGEEIIPLLASLPASEQRRAFRLSDRRRVVLATNVAETSVTIPGIRNVIDSGLARISRYVPRTRVQRLQVENISKASAKQRAGRCGRLGPGKCIRLYSAEDFASRDDYTPPEVLRTSLAGVILSMLDLGLGDISRFPFLDPPRPVSIREGFRELVELGAVERGESGEAALSAIGRQLARIPVEPRLARMLVEASRMAALPDAIVAVAALSCDDPRRRPIDDRAAADQAHARFRVPGSDFLGRIKLWRFWEEKTAGLSQSASRRLAKELYLSYPKMREWRDIVRQLERLARELKLSFTVPKDDRDAPIRLHRSLLAGFVGGIGKFDPEEREYRGPHGTRFAIHPASVLAKKSAQRRLAAAARPAGGGRASPPPSFPEWVMAGELLDTGRLFACDAAAIDPKWIESAAAAVCKHHYRSPQYDPATGFVRCIEQVTLYGLVVVPERKCDFSRIDPVAARKIFIRRALVDGEFPRPPPEVRAVAEVVAQARRRAEKARRPELFDEEALVARFEAAIPAEVTNADALRKWLKRASAPGKSAFSIAREDFLLEEESQDADFPDRIEVGGRTLRLSYRHDPDDPDSDGITCTLKAADGPALGLWRSDWLVPGALREKLAWMIMALPSAQRRILSPVSDTVAGLIARLKPDAPLEEAVRRAVMEERGIRIAPGAWANAKMPPHLAVRFRVLGAGGKTVALTRDLEEARRACEGAAARPMLPQRYVDWTFGPLPERVAGGNAGWKLEHFQGLVDCKDAVTIGVFPTAQAAAAAHEAGTLRLFLLALGKGFRPPFRRRSLSFGAALRLEEAGLDDAKVSEDILAGALAELVLRGRAPIRDEQEFRRRLAGCGAELKIAAEKLAGLSAAILDRAAAIEAIAAEGRVPAATAASVRVQLAWLVFPGFQRRVPLSRLVHYERYLNGAKIRLERARTNPEGDLKREARFAPYWERYRAAVTGPEAAKFDARELAAHRWALEEFRISLFAQELHTPEPVSEKRLDAGWAAIVKGKE